jgi:CDP-diacylglycerol---serine O-phosphatidyltransferase
VSEARPPRRRSVRRFIARPLWVDAVEAWVVRHVRVQPTVLSALKLLVVTPLIVLALRRVDVLPASVWLVSALFLSFFFLDGLEGVVSSERPPRGRFGRVFDRLTDYPLLLVVVWFALDVLPLGLLVAKVGIDVLLLFLFLIGRGRSENRLRSGMGYATLLALLFVGQGWGARVLTPQVVETLVWVYIAYAFVTAAYYVGLLQKRFVADALSAANLLCGGFAIYFATLRRFEISLLFVILGAAFDGFDGAAARRWGGTRFGVYSDDIADGFNYGVAPGVALYFVLGGLSGIVVGVFYTTFTIARLVFFTLNKSGSDPNYFAGVPSPVGGLIAMASIVVFQDHPGVVGLMIGVAAAQMVSFSTHYRHLGRAFGQRRRALVGAPLYLVLLLIGLRLWGARGAAAVILTGNLVYGFLPTFLAFSRVLSIHRASRRPNADEGGAAPAPAEGAVSERPEGTAVSISSQSSASSG